MVVSQTVKDRQQPSQMRFADCYTKRCVQVETGLCGLVMERERRGVWVHVAHRGSQGR